jgi:hypothetical protein
MQGSSKAREDRRATELTKSSGDKKKKDTKKIRKERRAATKRYSVLNYKSL